MNLTAINYSWLGAAPTRRLRHASQLLLIVAVMATVALPVSAHAKAGVLASNKLRLIVLTDINAYNAEPDDAESLIRLMLYANQIDIEAIITTPSWVCQTVDENSYQRILTAVYAYGQVQSNLAVHATGYPTEQYLLDRVKHGTPSWNMTNVGAMKGNEGSDFIISVVDNTNDSRPVWVAAWTGLSTLAQALYDVQATRSPAAVDAFASKINVYDIDSQDDCGAWIMHNFPGIKFLCSDWQFWGISTATDYEGEVVGDTTIFTDSWVRNNIQTHGPLGAAYPNRLYNFETDSPSFMYAILNGLTDPDEQSWGGWGGRFSEFNELNPPPQDYIYQDNEAYRPYYAYRDVPDIYTFNGFTFTNNMYAPTARWKRAFQNEMAARMAWSTNASYVGCNHSPVAVLDGDTTLNILTLNATPGQNVALSAAGSSDPDGDTLSYNWYVYTDPGTYKGLVAISNATAMNATVAVPIDASNDCIHVILEVTDNGIGFPLTAYRRALIKTGTGGVGPGTMTTVNDDVTGADNNQFEYVGSWTYLTLMRCNQDDVTSSAAPGDYFNVRFNGTQIKLYGLITFMAGPADVQIDGGAPTQISFFGAVPEGDVLLYSSPVLPQGPHIMTLTVVGGGFVYADKVNIFSLPTPPSALTCFATNGMLALSWPTNYLGWSLQALTNASGLVPGTNTGWHTLPGSESVTMTNLPTDPGNAAVFYRLNQSY